MINIADLLERDFSKPVEEAVRINNDDPDTVFEELTEYVATERIKAEYGKLFAGAAKSPKGFVGVWISGCFDTGKSHFAKNLALVLEDREVRGVSARSLFGQRVDSRLTPCESFLLDGDAEAPEVAAICQPGKACVCVLDGLGERRLKDLRPVVERFGAESLARLQNGATRGPAWFIVTAREKVPAALSDLFEHQIELSRPDMREVVARRVLRKQNSGESMLRSQFREHGAFLLQNVQLERCARRRTDFDEDQFVQFYPYLPHLIDLSIEIVDGIRRDPDAPQLSGGGNYTIVKQCCEMMVSDRTRLGEEAAGALVSLDKIYDLLEGSIPLEKQHDVFVTGERCEHKNHPGMAARVAKVICLMQFVKADLPRTTKNIAALLVQCVTDAPPALAVSAILEQMKKRALSPRRKTGGRFTNMISMGYAMQRTAWRGLRMRWARLIRGRPVGTTT